MDSVSKAMIGLFDEEVAIFPSKTTSRLFLYLDSTDVMVREEGYCLFDFNLIISSVGGTMGLFLGFSLYQTLAWLLGHFFRQRNTVRLRVEYN